MIWSIDKPQNEIDNINSYEKGTESRKDLKNKLNELKNSEVPEIPLIIGGEEVKTGNVKEITLPHDKNTILAKAHLAGPEEINKAIESSMKAKEIWSQNDWYHRASIFRKAADILSGRKRIENIASIMLNQSKNPYEAEIDLAELVDFWRYNSYFAEKIFREQPEDSNGVTNRFDWRPLEGFIFAITPFNFYSIGGNLPTAPAIVGNTSLWKPARSVIFSNYKIMEILLEAGLPDGVINFVPFSSKHANSVLENNNLGGIHFTGSYNVLKSLKEKINSQIDNYKSFPRIVGETGGKDFVFMHNSADIENVANNLIRGSYGYQGQKCSASSRAYIPKSKWEPVKQKMKDKLDELSIGPVSNLDNYMGAVIDESAYEKIKDYIKFAEKNEDYKIVYGGNYNNGDGWFIEPTIVETENPKSKLMKEEIFGPVLTVYVYEDSAFEETLKLCDETSPYALTGSIFARDQYIIQKAEKELRYSAGNFYINDKPTGAEVNRQPFGGARKSGTNDKAGSWLNLIRWLSPRVIKEQNKMTDTWKRSFQE